jgi:pilus assembly protein CpaE
MNMADQIVEQKSTDRQPFMAFVVDDHSHNLMQEVTETLLLPSETIRKGTVQEARSYLNEVRSPGLLIVDIEGVESPVEEIVALSEVCELGTRLIVLGDNNDVTLFRALLSIGAADYMVKPLTQDQVMAGISSLEDGGTGLSIMGRTGKIVSVIHARGGAGSSTVAANVGAIVADETDKRVVLVDLDTHFGDLALILGTDSKGGLADALSQPERIDDLFLERVTSQAADRLYVVGGEEGLTEPIGNNRDSVDTLLGELKTQFHYVIVDVPQNISDLVHRTLQISGLILIVTDLSLTGMRDCARLIKYVKDANPGCQIGLIANKVGENPRAEIPVAEFEKGASRKFDFQIPFEANTVLKAANLGEPITGGKGSVGKILKQIAERFIGLENTAKKASKKGLLASFARKG